MPPPHPARRPRRALVAAILTGAALLLGACGDDDEGDSGPKRVTIDGARESGRRVEAMAKGIVSRPVAVAIRVSAAPKQRVDVSWGLSCPKTRNGKDRRPTGGTYTTRPPNVRALRLPKREIAFCAVNAQARLTRSGRVRVAILASGR